MYQVYISLVSAQNVLIFRNWSPVSVSLFGFIRKDPLRCKIATHRDFQRIRSTMMDDPRILSFLLTNPFRWKYVSSSVITLRMRLLPFLTISWIATEPSIALVSELTSCYMRTFSENSECLLTRYSTFLILFLRTYRSGYSTLFAMI